MSKKRFRIAIFLSIAAVIYVIGAIYYNSNILPNTTMYNTKIQEFSNEELHRIISKEKLNLIVRDSRSNINVPMKEISFKVENADKLQNQIISNQNNFLWPFLLIQNKNYDIANIVIKKDEIAKIVKKNKVVINDDTVTQSKDAYFKINEETTQVEIMPEIIGNVLNEELVNKTILDELSKGKISFNLNRAIIFPNILAVDLDKLKEEVEFKISNIISINIPSKNQKIEPSASDKLKWISIDYNKKEIKVDKNSIQSYFKSINKGFSKNEKKTNSVYRVYNGSSVLVKKGKAIKGIDVYEISAKTYSAMKNNYPLKTDVKAITVSKPRVVYEGHKSSDSNFIEVSIPNQKLYLYSNGKLVLSASVVTGRAGVTPTPRGSYSIAYKTTNFTMRGAQYGYDYVLPVSYWMPLTNGDGVGFHDAPWRAYSSFGGNIYTWDGSHGCINMRLSDVSRVYNTVSIGTGVWIH